MRDFFFARGVVCGGDVNVQKLDCGSRRMTRYIYPNSWNSTLKMVNFICNLQLNKAVKQTKESNAKSTLKKISN